MKLETPVRNLQIQICKFRSVGCYLDFKSQASRTFDPNRSRIRSEQLGTIFSYERIIEIELYSHSWQDSLGYVPNWAVRIVCYQYVVATFYH